MSEQIPHIHAAKSEEIRARFEEPPLTDEEAADILFEMELRQEIEKISKRREIDLSL